MGIFRLVSAAGAGEDEDESRATMLSAEAGDTPSPTYPFNGSWRRIVVQAAGLWLATRVALVAFTYFAVLFRMGLAGATGVPLSPIALLDNWRRWDAGWYLGIAQHGYFNAQSTAFFPLYPRLLRVTAVLTGGHWTTAGLLVAHLGPLGGILRPALRAAY